MGAPIYTPEFLRGLQSENVIGIVVADMVVEERRDDGQTNEGAWGTAKIPWEIVVG